MLTDIRVLVVEDDNDARELLRAVFDLAGARVSEAADARAALTLLRAETPDVLVSDIAMPGGDGFWLIGELRALEAGRTIPALALTAHTSAEVRSRALAAGFQEHLTKPVDPWELCRVVAKLAR